MKRLYPKMGPYFKLMKLPQTFLLLLTGLTGYLSASEAAGTGRIIAILLSSLFLTLSGSTMLNMVIDRDIDARMKRTLNRPLPSGALHPREALIAGITISVLGLVLAALLSLLYCVVICFGWSMNVLTYSMALKRKTPWSILWGGISGGMPVLAGRALAVGQIDMIGILLAASIILWIPSHIMTFNMKYLEDYRRAGIPTFPSRYGFHVTRWIIALSSFGATLSIGIGSFALGLAGGLLWILAGFSIGILSLALLSLLRPSEKTNLDLFKFASLYLAGAMILLIFGTIK